MLQDGSSWRQPMRRRPALPDCTARPTGRTANHRQRVRSPLNAPAVKERFWLRKQRSPLTAPAVKERFWLRKQPPRTCRVNCGCIIVLKSTRPAWGEAGVTQGVRTAQPAVFDHIVFRERETRR